MTKKDYEKFARMLKAATPYPSLSLEDAGPLRYSEKVFEARMQYHADMIQSIAAIFANDNPNFNRQKFINAIIAGK